MTWSLQVQWNPETAFRQHSHVADGHAQRVCRHAMTSLLRHTGAGLTKCSQPAHSTLHFRERWQRQAIRPDRLRRPCESHVADAQVDVTWFGIRNAPVTFQHCA